MKTIPTSKVPALMLNVEVDKYDGKKLAEGFASMISDPMFGFADRLAKNPGGRVYVVVYVDPKD